MIIHPIKYYRGQRRQIYWNRYKKVRCYAALATIKAENLFNNNTLNEGLYILYNIADVGKYKIIDNVATNKISTILIDGKAIVLAGKIHKIEKKLFHQIISTEVLMPGMGRPVLPMQYILTHTFDRSLILSIIQILKDGFKYSIKPKIILKKLLEITILTVKFILVLPALVPLSLIRSLIGYGNIFELDIDKNEYTLGDVEDLYFDEYSFSLKMKN